MRASSEQGLDLETSSCQALNLFIQYTIRQKAVPEEISGDPIVGTPLNARIEVLQKLVIKQEET
jgi:hypothetical protein